MDSMAAFITSTSCPNLYFPSFQMQFQPPQQYSSSSCLIGNLNDDELLNLAAATCGFNFEENMLFDSTYNNNFQQIPFHSDFDSFIHFADQQLLHPLQTLNSPLCHNLELLPKTLTLTTPDVSKSAALLSVNNDGDRKRVTAQSLAARERRRKITRKTQELGKLIPGGTKMNTAQMLHSAFKYIQFLQCQLQLLQAYLQGSEEEKAAPPLHLVASPLIQQKLYTEGFCIIPRAFAQTLLHKINDSSISEELRGIIN